MDKETEEALEASIEKWEELAKSRRGAKVRIGVSACPLCALFHSWVNIRNACNGCPVKQRTGRAFCEGTPYDDVADQVRPTFRTGAPYTVKNGRKFRKAARAEVEFLKSLRT